LKQVQHDSSLWYHGIIAKKTANQIYILTFNFFWICIEINMPSFPKIKQPQQILILCGPSGSGKGTLVKHLLENHPVFALSVSCTTRKPRLGEQEGREYYFISENEFKRKISEKQFAEYEEVYEGRFYGTLKSEISRIHKLGKIPVFDIDYKGGLSLKKLYPQSIDIFLLPPSQVILEQRLRGRGTETEQEIEIRLAKANLELQHQNNFTYKLINNEWQETIVELDKILKKSNVNVIP
jgi:guanylate kinase